MCQTIFEDKFPPVEFLPLVKVNFILTKHFYKLFQYFHHLSFLFSLLVKGFNNQFLNIHIRHHYIFKHFFLENLNLSCNVSLEIIDLHRTKKCVALFYEIGIKKRRKKNLYQLFE